MASITKGGTLPDNANKQDFYDLIDNATLTAIVNADISASAAIADSKLAQITTAGKVSGSALTSLANIPAGAGNIPAANLGNAGGAKDGIVRGFEIGNCAVDDTTVIVQAGTLYHGTTQVDKTSNTTLTIATPGDWYDGSTHSYSGAADWCYIGVDSSGNIKFLHTNAPDKADTSGNTDGTLLYWYDSGNTKYWRVIGAIKIDTSDTVDFYFKQDGNYISSDHDQILTSGTATTFTDVDCSAYVPDTISRRIKVHWGLSTGQAVTVRENGNTVEDVSFSPGSNVPITLDINTDANAIFEYKVAADTSNAYLWVNYLNIR